MITKRINTILEKCKIIGKEGRPSHFSYDYNNSALSMYNDLPHYKKLALSMAYAIKNQDVWCYDYDNLGGRIFYNNEKEVEEFSSDLDYVTMALTNLKQDIPSFDELVDYELISCLTNGKDLWCNGHISWNYDYILKYGVVGLKNKYLNALSNPKDDKAKEFYEGVVILLDSMLEFNDKHILEYEKLGNNELARRMSIVPRYPAKSFIEAVQSFYMQHIVVMRENPFGGNSPGRLDYYLWPYLKNDLESNIITMAEAKEIIDELFLRIDERLYNYDNWTEAIVVGGSKSDGKSAVNPLTYLMVESIMDLNIIHPAVYIRVPKDYDDNLINLCSRYLRCGNNRAQLLNDEAIIKSLIKSGIALDDAYNYACGGCMEIGIQGKCADFLYGGFQNIPKILELMITGGYSLHNKKKLDFFTGSGLVNYKSFDDFYHDFIDVVKKYVGYSLLELETYSKLAEVNRPSYLLSSMIDSCFERGRNLNAGGAKYKLYGSTPMGLPNVIDSLYAIKYAVFDKKICSACELVDAMHNNYIGYDDLKYKLKSILKYGMDNDAVDSFASMVMADIADIYCEYNAKDGGRGMPVVLTFIHGPAASSILGASASGMRSCSSVAQGITPLSYAMKHGITAAINSCSKMPFDKFFGGASTMWDLEPMFANSHLLNVIVKSFIDKGLQIFQGNMTSVDELLKALDNPEEYPNLFVRVGGYSARFINLNKDLQYEIINRYRHGK